VPGTSDVQISSARHNGFTAPIHGTARLVITETAPILGDPMTATIAEAPTVTTAAQRRAAARTRDLTALLRQRPDLAGVHAPADFAVEAVRWCA